MTAQQAATSPAGAVESATGSPWLDRWGDLVLPVLLLSTLLPAREMGQFVPIGVPLNTLAALVLVFMGLLAPPRWRGGSVLVMLAGASLVGWLVLNTTLTHGLQELRRSGNIVTLMAVVAVIGAGRLHVRSIARGTAIGLVVGLGVGIALLPVSYYSGRLTGLFGDPNAAGFILTTLGFAAAQSLSTRRTRLLFWALVAGGVLLTQSRTSMFAFAVATLWILLSPRVGRLIGMAALGGAAWLFQRLNDASESSSLFAERQGSDSLREALAAAERQSVASAGWFGEGLGTAVAEVRGTTLFFHNSYRAMQMEGGIIAVLLLGALFAGIFFMFHQLPPLDRPVWAESALISSAICSVNIGFSLTHLATAVALGLFLAYHGAARERLATGGGQPGSVPRTSLG